MVKHPPKRRGRFQKYLRGAIDLNLALTTLGAQVLVSDPVGDTVNEKTWLSSVRGTWTLSEFTQASGRGPFKVGVAHSDYTDAEIEQWIENLGSWDEGDLVNQEIARRKIRMVGQFTGLALPDQEVLADGRPITTKCGWMLLQGQTVKVWAYNDGSAAVATTVPRMRMIGHANLWPK